MGGREEGRTSLAAQFIIVVILFAERKWIWFGDSPFPMNRPSRILRTKQPNVRMFVKFVLLITLL